MKKYAAKGGGNMDNENEKAGLEGQVQGRPTPDWPSANIVIDREAFLRATCDKDQGAQ